MTRPTPSSLRQKKLSRIQIAGTSAAVVAMSLLLFAVTPMQGQADFIVFTALLLVATLTLVTLAVEGRRRAMDRLFTHFAIGALVLALLPLVFVVGYTVSRGLKRFGIPFLTHSMAGVGVADTSGGVYHAIIGTLEMVLLASAMAVPLGILVAIYVTEYGRNAMGTSIRFLIDVMTGIPSIVAGLFILAFWLLVLQQPASGFAGALALAILELPIVVRSSEEMIKLVPASLREASYALGVPKWKTIVRIVLPTASTGITTGVMLAVARVTGETAPILLVVSNNNFINNDPFHGGQASLPVFIFSNVQSPFQTNVDRAWAAAMTLILIVVILYVAARLLTRRNTLARR